MNKYYLKYLIKLAAILSSILIQLSLWTSCKSSSRAVKVGAQILKIKIKLLNFDDNYFDKFKVVYILNCKDQRELGEAQQDSNEIIFNIKNVKIADICELTIKNLDNDTKELEFLKEKDLLYYSSYIVLESGSLGELIGYANLQKMFRPKTGDFKMFIPVMFSEIESKEVKSLVAQFTCTPSLPTHSNFLENYDKTTKKGVFPFLIKVSKATNLSYKCEYLNVFKDGIEKYRGEFNETITPIPQKTYERTVPIKLESISLQDYKNFVINIIEVSQCNPNEIFDINEKKCIKK